MKLLITDLDLTLIPNGIVEYDNALPLFSQIVSKYRIKLAYAGGRTFESILESIKQYNLPKPEFIIAQLGTKIFRKWRGKYSEDVYWDKYIRKNTLSWDIEKFKAELKDVVGLRLQENIQQNKFKLSYYLDDPHKHKKSFSKVNNIIKELCKDASIIMTVLPTSDFGYIDIIPRLANKFEAAEHIIKRLKIKDKDILFAGDSENDMIFLSSRYNAIIVKNASRKIKKDAYNLKYTKNQCTNLYVAKGLNKLNGNYVSGIIEGMIHFKWISSDLSQ